MRSRDIAVELNVGSWQVAVGVWLNLTPALSQSSNSNADTVCPEDSTTALISCYTIRQNPRG